MSDRPTFEERLTDPASHFPYKLDDAVRGAERAVRREVATLELYDAAVISELSDRLLELAMAEVEANDAYVAAQRDYLAAPSQESRAVERQAADALTAARATRREIRPRLIADARERDAAIQAEVRKG